MKKFAIGAVLVQIVAVALTAFVPSGVQFLESCQTDFNIHEIQILQIKDGNFTNTPHDVKCFLQCIFERTHIMSSGSFSDLLKYGIDHTLEEFKDNEQVKSLLIPFKECFEVTGTGCDLAYEYAKCLFPKLRARDMHSVGIHSALAIKRQRKRRDEQRKAKERRYSIQSSESGDTLNSPHGSTRRKFRNSHAQKAGNGMLDSKVVTSVGMLHIGVVFIVFGIFLLGAGIIPDDTPSWNMFGAGNSWWNEVTCTGLFSLGLGIFLLVLNCLISKKEEEDLEDYVQRQLTRSRSGHRLERDVETGVLTTRNARKALAVHKNDGSSENLSQSNITPVTSEMVTPTTPVGLGNSGEMLLEKILEEDSSYGEDRNTGLSPVSNDKKLLLGNGHTD